MPVQLILAAAIAAAGFGTAWQIQSWRYQAKEAKHVEQLLVNERAAATAAIRRTETVIAAQSAAQDRARVLRMDAAASRNALDGMRDATGRALQAGSVSLASCTERATAISVVLAQCGTAYQELGAVADRHASDVRTLIEAWPR